MTRHPLLLAMRSALPPCASRERPAQTKRCSGCRRALRAGSQFPPESRLRDSASLSYAEGTLRVVIRQSVSSRARVADPFAVDVRQRSQLVDLPTSKPASLASPLHSDDPLPPNSTDRTKTMTSANDLEKGDKVRSVGRTVPTSLSHSPGSPSPHLEPRSARIGPFR